MKCKLLTIPLCDLPSELSDNTHEIEQKKTKHHDSKRRHRKVSRTMTITFKKVSPSICPNLCLFVCAKLTKPPVAYIHFGIQTTLI